MNERLAAEVFSPGSYLAEELEARGVAADQFARLAQIKPERMTDILSGSKFLLLSECERIGSIMGTSAQMWINMDIAWRKWCRAREGAKRDGE